MLHPTPLGQLLEDTTLFLVCKELLELTLLVAKTLAARRHPRWRHGEQNVGAIHPVDMRYHRVKATRGDILEAQVLLDRFMKKFYCPAEPRAENDLACCERLSGNKAFITEDFRSYAWQGQERTYWISGFLSCF
jgi:hypothetical protein